MAYSSVRAMVVALAKAATGSAIAADRRLAPRHSKKKEWVSGNEPKKGGENEIDPEAQVCAQDWGARAND